MSLAAASWQVVTLDSKAHDRAAFSCGAPELDRYIREHTSPDVRRTVARVFVTLLAGTPALCGYYSLSATSFKREGLPAEEARRLPRYPVPAALLGRLAVDNGMMGKGLGAFLLMEALNRVLLATQMLAVHAVIVDARDETAAAFYRKYGFIPFTGEGRRLFLPMVTLRTRAEP